MNFENINIELTNIDDVTKAADKVQEDMMALHRSIGKLNGALCFMGVKIGPATDKPVSQEIGLDLADADTAHVEFETFYDGYSPTEGSIKLILSAADWCSLAKCPAFSTLLNTLEAQKIPGGKTAAGEIRKYLESMKDRRA